MFLTPWMFTSWRRYHIASQNTQTRILLQSAKLIKNLKKSGLKEHIPAKPLLVSGACRLIYPHFLINWLLPKWSHTLPIQSQNVFNDWKSLSLAVVYILCHFIDFRKFLSKSFHLSSELTKGHFKLYDSSAAPPRLNPFRKNKINQAI